MPKYFSSTWNKIQRVTYFMADFFFSYVPRSPRKHVIVSLNQIVRPCAAIRLSRHWTFDPKSIFVSKYFRLNKIFFYFCIFLRQQFIVWVRKSKDQYYRVNASRPEKEVRFISFFLHHIFFGIFFFVTSRRHRFLLLLLERKFHLNYHQLSLYLNNVVVGYLC